MYESLGDVFRKWSGRDTYVDPVRGLRGRVWLSHALYISGMASEEFSERYVVRGRSRSNLVRKWLRGDATPGPLSVAKVEDHLPGTAWVYTLPLWELLLNQPISRACLRKFVGQLTSKLGDDRIWALPIDPVEGDVLQPTVYYPDTEGLLKRNDIWGLIGCLLLTRICEQDRSQGEHAVVSQSMFRALPGALGYSWLIPFTEEMINALLAIRSRVLVSCLLYDVDRGVIVQQTTNLIDEANRNHSSEAIGARTLFPVSDPIQLSDVTLGRYVTKLYRS